MAIKLLLFLCLLIQSANVLKAKTWLVELSVKADFYSYTLCFGVDSLGTDGYDVGLDVAHPPPAFTFDSYFWFDQLPYFLFADIRASSEDSITWVLKIVNATGLVDTIAWDRSGLPSDGNLYLADTIDMKSSDKVVYAGDQTLTIRYQRTNLGYEELSESQSNIFLIDHGYANPVYSSTAIRYRLMMDSFVSLKIYDIRGALVDVLINQLQNAGFHTVHWYGKDSNNESVNSGLYFYRFIVRPIGNKSAFTQTKKLILLK